MEFKHIEKAILYIEDHLTSPITVEEVTEQVNFSYYHFHRLFKVLTGETLGSYIRKRRLTEAAMELLDTDHSIIDIAFNYQFESQEAFSRAFKKMFTIPPLRFRNRRQRPVFSEEGCLLGERLYHRLEGMDIQPTFIEIEEDKLIMGIEGINSIVENNLPELWTSFLPRIHEIHHKVLEPVAYSICRSSPPIISAITEDDSYKLLIGVEVTSIQGIPAQMRTCKIHAGKYVVFRHKGPVKRLQDTYHFIWGHWLQHTDKELDERDDFEVYGPDFIGPDHENSIVKIYIPVK